MTPIEQLLAEEECQAAQAAAKQAKKQRQKIKKQQQQQSQQHDVEQQQMSKHREAVAQPEPEGLPQQQQHMAEQQQQQHMGEQPTLEDKHTPSPPQEQQPSQQQKQQLACLLAQQHAERQPLQAHRPKQTQPQLATGRTATEHAGVGLGTPLPSMSGNVDSTKQANVASAEQLQSRPGVARELTGTQASPEHQREFQAAEDDDFLENLLSCPLTRVSFSHPVTWSLALLFKAADRYLRHMASCSFAITTRALLCRNAHMCMTNNSHDSVQLNCIVISAFHSRDL